MIESAMISNLSKFLEELKSVDFKPKTIQHQIDGLMYTSTKLVASDGLYIAPKLFHIVGSGLMNAVVASGETEVGLDTLIGVAIRLSDEGAADIIKRSLARVKVNRLAGMDTGGDVLPQFDEHFSGEYLHLLKVTLLALGHSFQGPSLGAS